MATKIIHKKSSVSAKIPLASDLEVGELALNLVDKKIYSKQTDGSVVEMSPTEESLSLGDWQIGTVAEQLVWSIQEDGGVVYFKYGTLTAMTIDNTGELTIANDLYATTAAGGTPVTQGATSWSYNKDGANLYFQYGSTNVMKLTSTGDLTIAGNLDANATLSGTESTSYYMHFSGDAKLEITTGGDLLIADDLNTNVTL